MISNALHLIRARDAVFRRREHALDMMFLSAMPGQLLAILSVLWALTMHGSLADEIYLCLLACALWPTLVVAVAPKVAARMRIVGGTGVVVVKEKA